MSGVRSQSSESSNQGGDEVTEGLRDGKNQDVRLKVKDWNLGFHSTKDIIAAAEQGKLPDKIMITIHPQRWHSRSLPWVKELVGQNVKNAVKYFIVKKQSHFGITI